MATVADFEFMTRALQLARRGLFTTDPNPRVGCVVVNEGGVVGEGWHERAGDPHAEVYALNMAGARARGGTVYVTLEPCSHHGRTPPCAEALLEAGVSRVVVAMEDPNPRVSGRGLSLLHEAGVETESGVLAEQAEALNPGFAMRMRRQRPFVRCKLAMSLDGRTAMASGESQWITADAARTDVHRWRARSSAMLSGIGTVRADDPSLNVRLAEAEPAKGWRQPLRVVLDPQLQLSPNARMLSLPGDTLVVTASNDLHRHQQLMGAGAQVVQVPGNADALELPRVMSELAAREVNEVMVEAGPRLNGALLRAELVDELVIYMAPHLMGDAARGLFHLPELDRMEQRLELDIRDIRAVGRDWRMICRVAGSGR